MSNTAEILIVEDDSQIRRFLRATFTAEEYRFHEAVTAEDGVVQAAARHPDLIVLDLGLPDRDGLEVIRKVREWTQTPIIVLSARGQEKDKVDALDAGADDFVSKPFAVRELLARVRAALRRSATINDTQSGGIFQAGQIAVDFVRRVVSVSGSEIHLTPIEYKLLQTLIRHAGKVITQRQLLVEVWGPNHSEHGQYLRVYMAQLRRKLEKDPARPRHFLTEPGFGYRLVQEDQS